MIFTALCKAEEQRESQRPADRLTPAMGQAQCKDRPHSTTPSAPLLDFHFPTDSIGIEQRGAS